MKKTAWIYSVLALCILAGLVLSGCAPALQATPTATDVPAASTLEPAPVSRLRITNSSTTDIIHLVVQFPDSRIEFGDVPAGQTTDYQLAPNGVYNYAAYEFEVNGETQIQPVVDWVGESPRPGQSYTYVIELDASQPVMQQIKLIEVLADLNE